MRRHKCEVKKIRIVYKSGIYSKFHDFKKKIPNVKRTVTDFEKVGN